MPGLLTLIWEALQMALFMFCEVLWPLVLGFAALGLGWRFLRTCGSGMLLTMNEAPTEAHEMTHHDHHGRHHHH
ncbi:MAG TPA: hypothetical protein VI172_05125 [Candidatus Dormibacteraeota bacterium]